MAAPDTRAQIVLTAERLFAGHGIAATSLRTVVAEAGVNVAAVHYHFGSKEELVRTVLRRRVDPMNAERLRMLDAAEAAGDNAPDRLERIIEALVAPPLRLSRDREAGGAQFMKLIGRTFAEADDRLRQMFFEMFEEVVRRFFPAFQLACPHLPPATLFWRCHFLIGAMAHTMCEGEAVKMYSAGVCDTNDIEGIIRQLVTFTAAGLREEDIVSARSRPRKTS